MYREPYAPLGSTDMSLWVRNDVSALYHRWKISRAFLITTICHGTSRQWSVVSYQFFILRLIADG